MLIVLAACTLPPMPTPVPAATRPAKPAASGELPAAVEYNLGEATIVQERFPEDSRFRNMPVQLNGLIAVPPGDGGPYPVVVIFHGTHPGCPEDETGVDRWPCDPEVEQPNYRGFEYLVRAAGRAGLRGPVDQHQRREHLRLRRAGAGRAAANNWSIYT